jgi:pyruvate-formate lyase
VALLKGFRNLKLWRLQFNTRKHPEKYRDLVVRGAGYSALFLTLERGTRDDIIRGMSCDVN